LGDVARCERDYQEAEGLLSEALQLTRDVGDHPTMTWALSSLGFVALHQGDIRRARTCFADGLRLAHASGQPQRIAACLVGVAGVAAAEGRGERSVQFLGAAGVLQLAGAALDPADRGDADYVTGAARALLAEEAFAMARTAGEGQPLDQAIRAALAEQPPHEPA
jgi:hypothetical protein